MVTIGELCLDLLLLTRLYPLVESGTREWRLLLFDVGAHDKIDHVFQCRHLHRDVLVVSELER